MYNSQGVILLNYGASSNADFKEFLAKIPFMLRKAKFPEIDKYGILFFPLSTILRNTIKFGNT